MKKRRKSMESYFYIYDTFCIYEKILLLIINNFSLYYLHLSTYI